jgi:branched-chain amino acid aminotransferase
MSEDAIASDDRSFLYGDGLFETVRVRPDGRIRWLERHIERLRRSGEALGFASDHIERGVDTLAGLVDEAPGIWRVTVSRGGQGAPFGGSGSISRRRRAFSEPARPALDVAQGFYLPGDSLAEHKTTSFVRYVEARRRAQQRGLDDAVLVSGDGLVGEASCANLVAVVDGAAITPPVRGILPGVTRAGLLDAAAEQSAPIEVRELSLAELRRADEVALLSAGVGVLAAKSLEGRALDDSWATRAREWLA